MPDPSETPAPTAKPDRVFIENVNHPGSTTSVDAAKYTDMREALLAVLPTTAPGMTEQQMRAAVLPKLSSEHFPGGERANWWAKAVQLDLEAKGLVARERTQPLRWHRPAEVTPPLTARPPRVPRTDLGRPANVPRPRPG